MFDRILEIFSAQLDGASSLTVGLTYIWAAFWIYWSFAARGNSAKSATTSTYNEPGRTSKLHTALFAVSFALLLMSWSQQGALGWRIFPNSSYLMACGFALTVSGLAFAVWARLHLGRYWSGNVSIKEDHKLIQTGPYRFVRHPIYTGILVGMIGTAIAVGEVRAILAIGFLLAALMVKIPQEEQALTSTFGRKYANYRKKVKALVPYVV